MTFKVSILDQLIKHNQDIIPTPIESSIDISGAAVAVSDLKVFLKSRVPSDNVALFTNMCSEIVLPGNPEPRTATALLEEEVPRPRGIWDQILQSQQNNRARTVNTQYTIERNDVAELPTEHLSESLAHGPVTPRFTARAAPSYQDIAPPVTDRVIPLETEEPVIPQTTPSTPAPLEVRTLFGGQVVLPT